MSNLRTSVSVYGYDWRVTTDKGRHGFLETWAHAGHLTERGWTCLLYADPSILLYRSTATRATEKAVRETHIKGMEVFSKKIQDGTLPECKAPNPERIVNNS
jgi:hypothetical protein